jgi:hypothetical protein
MNSSLHRVASLSGIVWLAAIASMIAIGCSGMNPFLSTQFLMNSSLVGRQSQGTTTTPATQTTDTTLTSVCDLPSGPSRTLQLTVQNESLQFVKFSMTFLASSGSGGFVCDSEILTYQNAGYSVVGTGNSVVIGCDTVLLSGTQILAMQFGSNQGAAAVLAPATVSGTTVTPTTFTLRTTSGSSFIPLPQVIVFGSNDTDFPCVGSDACTQRGFVYTNAVGVPIGKAVEASRIQGTVCNSGFGTAPEWRLNTALLSPAQLFQYPFGASIVVDVLDRSADLVTNTRNQAVWLVADVNGGTVHNPNP